MAKQPFLLSADIADLRVISIAEAAALNSLSADTIRRNHSDKILRLSRRRQGMRLRDALALGRTSACDDAGISRG
jgi:hypothetical protein